MPKFIVQPPKAPATGWTRHTVGEEIEVDNETAKKLAKRGVIELKGESASKEPTKEPVKEPVKEPGQTKKENGE